MTDDSVQPLDFLALFTAIYTFKFVYSTAVIEVKFLAFRSRFTTISSLQSVRVSFSWLLILGLSNSPPSPEETVEGPEEEEDSNEEDSDEEEAYEEEEDLFGDVQSPCDMDGRLPPSDMNEAQPTQAMDAN